jgi:hypothetical protein
MKISSKSVRKQPETLKCKLPSSTVIREAWAWISADSSSSRSEAGRQIALNDEQPENAPSSIRHRAVPVSHLNDERQSQKEKQSSQSIVTDDGIHIDSNEEQNRNRAREI